MNTPSAIFKAIPKRLHLQPDHPIAITRQLIESCFPSYRCHNDLFPIVSSEQNFDSLGFSEDHIGRSRTDTYYLNKKTLLRTHTSAHQADTFRANESEGFLISADVYRRDAVDRSHYPIFHQMEGARLWDSAKLGKNLAKQIWADIEAIPRPTIKVEDPNPMTHAERNPLQECHNEDEAEAVATHLKRSLETVVVKIFTTARDAAASSGHTAAMSEDALKVRWVEAYFPFTSPSWELEVYWQGEWLEVLGCGVIRQPLLNNAGVHTQIGWAFGIGLERIAMLLFDIPDIRLFWSQDQRFLSQFGAKKPMQRFVPFSKFPECYKDVSFWIRGTSNSAGGGSHANAHDFHENDVMEIVRDVAGDLVEDVRLTDEFTHPQSRKKSVCYRINYRSLERTLRNEEVNELHSTICQRLVDKLDVEIR